MVNNSLRRAGHILVMAAAVVACAAQARPAPWYWWVSVYDGQRVCAQFMPSQGWRKAEGPYANGQCRVR